MSAAVARGPIPFEPDGENYFSQKQIAEKRGVTLRTIRRDVRRYKVPVFDFTGLQPIFTRQAVEEMERKRREALRRQIGVAERDEGDDGSGVISLKQMRAVKREARRNGKARR